VLGPTDFQKRLLLGFGVTLLSGALISLVALVTIRTLGRSIGRVADLASADLLEVERLRVWEEREIGASRGFLLTGDRTFEDRAKAAHAASDAIVGSLGHRIDSEPGRTLLRELVRARESHERLLWHLMSLRTQHRNLKQINELFEELLQPHRLRLDQAIEKLRLHKESLFQQGRSEVHSAVHIGIRLTLLIALVAIGGAGMRAVGLSSVLGRIYREAQDAIRLREDLVSIVSHDLKNPLTAIRLNASLLRRDQPPELNERSIQGIETACCNMQALISDLLDVARMEAGGLPLQGDIHEISKIAVTAIDAVRPIAQAKGVRIELRSGEQLSSWVDPHRLQQILANLIGNAIKFSPPGSTISLKIARAGAEVRVEVADQGRGIPDQQLPFLFERFRQASTGDAARGTGLGLYIARNLVEAHGGRIGVRSVVGQGSTFWFSLPLKGKREGGRAA
jgi:signal transduction histidine kinase